jgi:Skp family chaperone for outer membrane proteins
MEYILENVPEYQEATRQLESRTQKWKSEIETKLQNVEDMKQNLENERALLTKELIEEREEEIDYEEQAILEYQEEKFGPQGQFIVQKRQLVQPVQDQVFNAVQQIGEKRQYDFIFENSADALLLFSAKRHDISDQVLSIIQRSSRKLDMENRRDEKEKDEVANNEPYKSVEKAAEDKREVAEREAIRESKEDERQQLLDDRQRKRDSIRDARQREFEERRAKLLEDRERKRDSLENLRNQRNNTNNAPPGAPSDNK